jgi:hypothetical protein
MVSLFYIRLPQGMTAGEAMPLIFHDGLPDFVAFSNIPAEELPSLETGTTKEV